MEGTVLGHRGVAAGAVERARGGEEEPRDSGGLGHLRHVDGPVGVDGVRGPRVEVADRVVGDGREVDDGVEAVEVLGDDVADVPGALDVAGGLGTEVAPVVPPGVQADDLVPRALQERDQDCPDVAPVTVDQNSHNAPSVDVETVVYTTFPSRQSPAPCGAVQWSNG